MNPTTDNATNKPDDSSEEALPGRPGSDALPEESAIDINGPADASEVEPDGSDALPGRPGSDALPEESAIDINGPADDTAS